MPFLVFRPPHSAVMSMSVCILKHTALVGSWWRLRQATQALKALEAVLRPCRAAVYTSGRFQAALSVVLSHAAYLPSASCFVLLPLLSQV